MKKNTQLGPTLSQISNAQGELINRLIITPTLQAKSDRWSNILPKKTNVFIKLELFQQSGSFKARGAFLAVNDLSPGQKKAGVVAASGGNHALAVSWAASAAGVSAKIAMPKATDILRIEGCKASGAEVILCRDIAESFELMNSLAKKEDRAIIHPFDDAKMILGAATCAAEYVAQHPDIDYFVIPVGGGGLISGMAAAIKKLKPTAIVVGVEPLGADGLYQSIKSGHPITLQEVNTIADSLGAPMTLPLSFSIAQRFVDKVVRVSDEELLQSMMHYQEVLRITAEPACAASLAAIIGPLREEISGRTVGILACGSNISLVRYDSLLKDFNIN
ncbi:MAG: threonine dehydratase [Paracoccaceae bacterium]|jgi:threonine dehydratase